MNYSAIYQRSIDDPAGFWRDQAAELDWYRFPETILGRDEAGHDRWFTDGELNLSHLALDHHIEQGRGGQTAVIYDSPVTGQKRAISYHELRDEVARLAGGLRDLGVVKGDRVVIYMPMVPEAVVAMLACARLGAIHSVVFGGFQPHELAVRIDDARPRVLITASCGIEVNRVLPYKPLVEAALDETQYPPATTVVLQRPECTATLAAASGVTREVDWHELIQAATPADPVPVEATHPLYILYTSGTTGKPKGVVRDTGGYAVALNFSMQAIYDLDAGDVFWTASDVGWVVGHSYIVYAPLIRGCTTIVYEGKPVKTPDAGAFWRVLAEHRVKAFFTAPTAFRAVRKEDPEAALMAGHNLSALERIYLAGERLDPPTYGWIKSITQRPVIDHWWQTETGWAIAANPMGIEPHPEKSGSAALPVPGYQVEILDGDGVAQPPGQQGSIALKLPLPPGCLPTLWADDERFRRSYLQALPGYYDTADGGYIDEAGYLFVMGRMDDVINVAGHRLSTGEMEEMIGDHPAVAECAVVGVADALKGEMPMGFVVLKSGETIDPARLEKELMDVIRSRIGAIASLQAVAVVDKLPKTRSGKILRKSIRQLTRDADVAVPATIEDPTSLDAIHEALAAVGKA